MKPRPLLCLALAALILSAAAAPALATSGGPITEGRLDATGSGSKPLGSCPLKHTAVTVDVSGFIARVTVRQQFHNPFDEKIEAIYVFPLSQDAAVDRMTMKVGDRIVKGEIKERGEARAIYEQAKAAGKVASLLDQERPNIFTQSVANIEPGEQVDISISYSETLDWSDGEYHFDFPMVVGPRYIPGGGSAPAPMTTWFTPGTPSTGSPVANRRACSSIFSAERSRPTFMSSSASTVRVKGSIGSSSPAACHTLQSKTGPTSMTDGA